jgi:hypothetical protein
MRRLHRNQRVRLNRAVNYDSLPYSELRSLASKRGLLKQGMKKADLIDVLSNAENDD